MVSSRFSENSISRGLLLVCISILLVYPVVACSEQRRTVSPPNAVNFGGRWSTDCENARGFEIDKNGKALIEVNSNQIYVVAQAQRKTNQAVSLAFVRPDDLGAGGMRLDWSNFSTEKSIANITAYSNDNAKLSWYGFYNQKLNRYEWQSEPDFVSGESAVEVVRCQDN